MLLVIKKGKTNRTHWISWAPNQSRHWARSYCMFSAYFFTLNCVSPLCKNMRTSIIAPMTSVQWNIVWNDFLSSRRSGTNHIVNCLSNVKSCRVSCTTLPTLKIFQQVENPVNANEFRRTRTRGINDFRFSLHLISIFVYSLTNSNMCFLFATIFRLNFSFARIPIHLTVAANGVFNPFHYPPNWISHLVMIVCVSRVVQTHVSFDSSQLHRSNFNSEYFSLAISFNFIA